MMKNKHANQHHKGTSILPRQNKLPQGHFYFAKAKNGAQGGFLELIVIILVALILLRFLNIDINGILAKGWVKEFIGYTKEMLVLVWQDIVAIYRSVKGA